MMQIGFPNDLQQHVSNHILKFVGVLLDPCASLTLSGPFKIMRTFRKHEATQILKTWCNSWATSYRYHEDTLHGCLLGCPDQADRLEHYLSCPIIWNLARGAYPLLDFESILKRLCVVEPCTESLKVLAATFPSYHAIKPANGEGRLSHNTARCVFADTFYTALRSAGCSPEAPAAP